MSTTLIIFSLAAAMTTASAAFEKTFTITEPFGLEWGPDRVSYRVEFPPGEVTPDGVRLKNAAGEPVAVQVSEIEHGPDGKTVKAATVSFMATLKPDEKGVWTLQGGKTAGTPLATDLTVSERDGVIELTTSRFGIRLAGGTRRFDPPVAAADVAAPIQGVRFADGTWIGRGWWDSERACLGYTATVDEHGPVFARVRLRYEFEGDKHYTATVELNAGQDLAIISEEFNLAEGGEYEMPEQPGEAGRKYRLVRPTFDPPERGLLWDWWGGTGGRIPSPNAYFFSFHEGLEPTHCQWNGRMFHIFPGVDSHGSPHGTVWRPLSLGKNSRVVSINAFLNWGSDEALFFGAFNPAKGREVAIIGLRPSQWINPDLEPKPIKTLRQWTQTASLWIERRATPDLFLRAPVMLGRRVYAISALQGNYEPEGMPPSNLILKHIRHGRQRLDEIKDWVLDYPEPATYPRLLGTSVARDELQRRARKWLVGDPHPVSRALTSNDPDADRKAVEEAISSLGDMCRRIATISLDHNGYAMNLPRLAWLADVALGTPACTPEKAALIRRYVAACAYNALSPDYVPPREAGYAWGSANMMEALRLRGATPMVCLLPNHPNGPRWRQFLARFVKLNAREKINEAGATLEPGAYGVMGIEFATVPAIMLAGADPSLDYSELLPLWRAAAIFRLSYLTPPDVRGGIRTAAPIGDSPLSGEGAFPFLIGALAERDRSLAEHLMWGIQENAAALGGHGTPLGLLVPTDLEPKVPDLRSTHFKGSGFILRSGFPHPEETYVNINCGSFAIGHGHPDRHGFILYAKGAPLMLDFASQYSPSIGQSWLHNGMITFDHREDVRPCPGRDKEGCYFTGKVWVEHTIEPFTCLEFGWPPNAANLDEAFGQAESFVTTPQADYAAMRRRSRVLDRVPYMLEASHGQFLGRGENEPVGLDSPIEWRRQVILVKSPDVSGPNYLVIRDTLSGNQRLTPALNYWCLADELKMDGSRATWKGPHGVDLDVYVAEPSAFTPVSHRVGHSNAGPGPFGRHYQATFGKPFREEQILLQIPQRPGGRFFTVLVPRKANEAAPTFETVQGGDGIRVTFPDGRADTVILRDKGDAIEMAGRTLTGPAIVVSQRPGQPPDAVELAQNAFAADRPAKAVYTIGRHAGKPAFFENGKPVVMPSYCSCGPAFDGWVEAIQTFARHGGRDFWLSLVGGYNNEWGTTPFWTGPGQIHNPPVPITENYWSPKAKPDGYWSVDRQAETILAAAPDARLFIRLGDWPPESWSKAYPDDLLTDSLGNRRPYASLASKRYREEFAAFIRAFVAYCESRPWADRIVAYILYPMGEGGTPLAMEGFLFDRSPVMRDAFRTFLTEKYGSDEALRQAWGRDDVSLATVEVPRDDDFRERNGGQVLFWPESRQVRPERDYFELQARLFRQYLKNMFEAFHDAAGPNRLLGIDAFKGNMLGWMCHPIFTGGLWKHYYGDNIVATGSTGMGEMLDWPDFHIIATPHDYRCRWIGFGYDPEGIGDSVQLRGKIMMVEEDQRTYANQERGLFGSVEPGEEEAIFFRNLAASLSKGQQTYPMDVTVGYFQNDTLQAILAKRREIEHRLLDIPREDVPSVVMLVDERAALYTDFSCAYNDLAVIRQRIWGMNRCGVPARTFLWDDLERDDFPAVHKLFLLPNCYVANERNRRLLREKLFLNGNVIVFGPGSGITDGEQVGPDGAADLLGMDMELYPYEYPRFVTIDHWEHPLTEGFGACDSYGDTHRYGPVLLPYDRSAPKTVGGQKARVVLAQDDRPFVRLGTIPIDNGKRRPGLVVKEFGRGAAGNGTPGPRGPGDYAVVFTAAVPLPARLLRNLARFSGTHVYNEDDDVVYADTTMVAVHAVKPGLRRIHLPGTFSVEDLITGEAVGDHLKELVFEVKGPVTRWWRLKSVTSRVSAP